MLKKQGPRKKKTRRETAQRDKEREEKAQTNTRKGEKDTQVVSEGALPERPRTNNCYSS